MSETLRAAGATLDRFSREADGVLGSEKYVQQVWAWGGRRMIGARLLKSDVMILSDVSQGWLEFRDVVEVDNQPVPDRQDRLAKLFTEPDADAIEQGLHIMEESARYNLDANGLRLNRTLNLPTVALWFLRTKDQVRSLFHQSGNARIDGAGVSVVTFQEIGKPRFIRSPDDAAAHGTFWIEPDTGVVRRSELILTSHTRSASITARIRVDYKLQSRLHLWLPDRMDEHYYADSGSIAGEATYSEYRKFRIAVEEKTR